MSEPSEYKTTDQLLIFSLLLAGAKAKSINSVKVDDRHQCVYVFDTTAIFVNNNKTWVISDAITLILKGETSCFVFTLSDYWAAQNTWLMNMRHKNVLSV
jgi:hypothetical protein